MHGLWRSINRRTRPDIFGGGGGGFNPVATFVWEDDFLDYQTGLVNNNTAFFGPWTVTHALNGGSAGGGVFWGGGYQDLQSYSDVPQSGAAFGALQMNAAANLHTAQAYCDVGLPAFNPGLDPSVSCEISAAVRIQHLASAQASIHRFGFWNSPFGSTRYCYVERTDSNSQYKIYAKGSSGAVQESGTWADPDHNSGAWLWKWFRLRMSQDWLTAIFESSEDGQDWTTRLTRDLTPITTFGSDFKFGMQSDAGGVGVNHQLDYVRLEAKLLRRSGDPV